MTYINGQKVLPPELLAKVQEHVRGELIYIPQKRDTRRPWGSKNGARQQIDNRNREMIRHHQEGHTNEELTQVFFLSHESVRKIVYRSRESQGTT